MSEAEIGVGWSCETPTRARFAVVTVFILVSMMISSCALSPDQKKAIGTFANATTALSASVSSNLPEMRSRVADMNTRWITITTTAEKGEPDPKQTAEGCLQGSHGQWHGHDGFQQPEHRAPHKSRSGTS